MTRYEVIRYDREYRGGEVIGKFTNLEEAKEFTRKERLKILEAKEDAFIHLDPVWEDEGNKGSR